MDCIACGTPATKVKDSQDDGSEVKRKRQCACGAVFYSTETALKKTLRVPISRQGEESVATGGQQAPPISTHSSPLAQVAVGGVGGDLSSGSVSVSVSLPGSVPDRILSLLPDHGVDPVRAKRRKTAASETILFGVWYDLYPRKIKRAAAASAWVAMGLDTKADEVIAALRSQLEFFMAQPMDKIPHPASWLNSKRWTDDPEAYRLGHARPNGHSSVTPGKDYSAGMDLFKKGSP